METVIRINEDKELWCAMVEEPCLNGEMIDRHNKQIEEYSYFTNHIFEQGIREAKRVYQGTAVWNYINFQVNNRRM